MKLLYKNDHSIEKPFWQSEWQNIKFESLGVQLFNNQLASSDFYSSFYKKLFSIYKDFESLPLDWLHSKTETAKAIGDEISRNASVLSYGCGLGFIEKQLLKYRSDLSITAFDFADTAGLWIKDDSEGISYVHSIPTDAKYDVIYLSQVLYAFSFSDSIELLKSLSQHLTHHGQFILINTSISNFENGIIAPKNSVKSKLKGILKPIYRSLFSSKNEQFWGWERNNQRYIEISIQAKLKPIKSFSKANQSFIVLGHETSSASPLSQ